MSLKLSKPSGGFTLLELLIVIVIIGILGLIIIPGLVDGPARARDATRKSNLNTIKSALEAYFNDTNAYPSTSTTPVVVKTDPTISKALVPTYLKAIPDDPKAPSRHYYYECTTVTSSVCTSFILYTSLENAKDSAINYTGAVNGYEVKSVN